MEEPRQQGTILIVDDDPSIRETLAGLLRDEGYGVSEAASGHGALEQLSGAAFDLVISDVRMPNGDGVGLLQDIRALQPDLPIFIMSGLAALSPSEARRIGAKAFFYKPFDINELLDEIEALMPARS